jgi:hypothetical protein
MNVPKKSIFECTTRLSVRISSVRQPRFTMSGWLGSALPEGFPHNSQSITVDELGMIK